MVSLDFLEINFAMLNNFPNKKISAVEMRILEQNKAYEITRKMDFFYLVVNVQQQNHTNIKSTFYSPKEVLKEILMYSQT